MNELYQRMKEWKNKMIQSHKENTEHFMNAIATGQYPKKCLRCYKMGFTWCRYWKQDFECEKVTVAQGEEIVKKFR